MTSNQGKSMMILTTTGIAERIRSQLNFTGNKSFDCVGTLLGLIKKTLASGLA